MAIALKDPPSVTEFYREMGRALMDQHNYPSAIVDHLDSERAILNSIVRRAGYTAAVEVGCADGSVHLDTLLKLQVAYVGIDIVPEFVSRLNRRLKASNPVAVAHARLLDASRLSSLAPALRAHKPLVVFSFNSFGNLENPHAVLAEVSTAGLDLLILTYRTDRWSSRARRDYYERCNLEQMRQKEDSRGVVFYSGDGLRSYAYRRRWMLRILHWHAFESLAGDFGLLGRFFWCCPKSKPPARQRENT